MSGPGIPKSKRIEKTISLVDVMPTVLSLLGIPKPSSLDGLDICPQWRDSNPRLPERYIFAKASKDTALPDERNIRHDIKLAARHGCYKLNNDRLSEKT
jgi:arylsulfatase A-like enzyme